MTIFQRHGYKTKAIAFSSRRHLLTALKYFDFVVTQNIMGISENRSDIPRRNPESVDQSQLPLSLTTIRNCDKRSQFVVIKVEEEKQSEKKTS